MMLEKPKQDENNSGSSAAAPTLIPGGMEASSNDREQDLERRLEMLGTGSATAGNQTDNLMSFENSTSAPVAQAPATVKPNKNALLAKIMAAQERAKQAQMKQTNAPIEQTSTTMLPAPTQMEVNTQQRKEKTMSAFDNLVDPSMTNKETEKPSLPLSQLAQLSVSQQQQMTATAPPAMPPPSFDIFEQQQKKEEEIAVAPVPVQPPAAPAFDDHLNMLGIEAPAEPPSAPVQGESLLDGFDTITPVAPLPPQPTPTTNNVTQTENAVDDDNMFEYDMDGNKLSPEERRKLMEEQRAIMEQIQKQAVENKASEAAVRANAFESRMTETALQVVPPTTSNVTTPGAIDLNTADVDLSSVDPAQVEEQRAILAEIERQKTNRVHVSAPIDGYQSPSPDFAVPPVQSNPRITEGVREALQMEEDRKLAEALQQEENRAAEEDEATGAPDGESTWWDTIAGAMGGTETTTTQDYGNRRSAEINLSRPPGSMTPSQRAMHGSGNGPNPRAAVVAESKPLFSCVVDSVTSAATAAAAGVSSMAYGDEEEVNGVDTTSFLSVPKAGEDRESSGAYSSL